MAIQELKGDYLIYSFSELHQYLEDNPQYKPSEDPNKRFILGSLPSKVNQLYDRTYLLVDFYHWLELVQKDKEYRKYIPNNEFIMDNLEKYSEFRVLTSYRLTSRSRLAKLIESYLDFEYLEDLFRMYELFLNYMQNTQSQFIQIFKQNNKANPVALLPWSYALNRLTYEIYMVREEGLSEENSVEADTKVNNILLRDINRKEGNKYTYKITSGFIKDEFKESGGFGTVDRIKIRSPIRLVSVDVDLTTEELLPDSWRRLFKIIRPELEGYAPRLELLKLLISQYMFSGIHSLGDSKIFLLNFPFANDAIIKGTGIQKPTVDSTLGIKGEEQMLLLNK